MRKMPPKSPSENYLYPTFEKFRKWIKDKIENLNNKIEITILDDFKIKKDTIYLSYLDNKKEIKNIEIPIDDFMSLNPNINFLTLEGRDKIIIDKKIERQNDIEIVSIGDPNGSLETYLWNFDKTNLINENGKWIGGKTKVVVHGDILSDRNEDGFKILLKNRELRRQAKKARGDIILLAGNHDDMMFSFLLKRGGVHRNGIFTLEEQQVGLFELMEFSKTNKEDLISGIYDMEKYRYEILKNMQKTKKGKILLEEMCNMKLCEKIGNTLFIHTDPTKKILKEINNNGVKKINDTFQKAMKESLLNGNIFNKKKYNDLFDTFLDTRNRDIEKLLTKGEWDLSEEIKTIKERGIKKIVFGHSILEEKNQIITIDGIELVGVDQGSLRELNNGKKSENISAAGFTCGGKTKIGKRFKK